MIDEQRRDEVQQEHAADQAWLLAGLRRLIENYRQQAEACPGVANLYVGVGAACGKQSVQLPAGLLAERVIAILAVYIAAMETPPRAPWTEGSR